METNWSDRVETLLNEGKETEAEALLQNVIQSEERQGGGSLGLAAALNDLGLLYCKQGLSLKADPLLQKALAIRKQLEERPFGRANNGVVHQLENLGINDRTTRADTSGAQSPLPDDDTADWEERDWDDDVAVSTTAPQNRRNSQGEESDDFDHPSKPQSSVGSGSKPRGRGAVRFGGGSLYSDRTSEELEEREFRRGSRAEEADTWRRSDASSGTRPEESAEQSGRADESDDWAADRTPLVNAGEMEHVIEVYGFAPTVKTMDLETLFWAFRDEGVAIKWVDDTHAVAVFRKPSAARAALASVTDSKFKLRPFAEASLSAQRLPPEDLRPPLARPETTARAARRLIASALDDTKVKKAVRAMSNPSDEKRLEAERRSKRNLTHQLKADAWGDGYS